MGMSLNEYKLYVSDQMLVVMGQMDSASQILDYLYLVSVTLVTVYVLLYWSLIFKSLFLSKYNNDFLSIEVNSIIFSFVGILKKLCSLEKKQSRLLKVRLQILFLSSFNYNHFDIIVKNDLNDFNLTSV